LSGSPRAATFDTGRGDGKTAWRREAEAWLREVVERHGGAPGGGIEWVRESPWSLVLRMRAREGFVYFKASGEAGRHEAAVMAELSRVWSDRVPAPVACDAARGWMVLADHGQALAAGPGEGSSLELWQRLLPLYAEIQVASAAHVEDWRRLGVPDRGLDVLADRIEDLLGDDAAIGLGRPGGLASEERTLLRALVPELRRRCRELAAMPASTALDHGDLHAANVLRHGEEYRFFDWGDASLSHPFASLLPVYEMLGLSADCRQGSRDAARLRDAYLEPWGGVVPAASRGEVVATAVWLAHAARALGWHHVLQSVDAVARWRWRPLIARWLRLWLTRRQFLVLDPAS